MAVPLTLVSHRLCPYVQRAVIALTEKGVPFERIVIDLANKPDWFLKISPLGKTPVLLVVETRSPIVNVMAVLMFPVFEPSAVGVPMSLKAWVPSTSIVAACTLFIGDRQIASADSPKRINRRIANSVVE